MTKVSVETQKFCGSGRRNPRVTDGSLWTRRSFDKVKAKIRCIKEMMRSIIARLSYRQPKTRVKDLAICVVSGINTSRSVMLNDNGGP